MSGSTEWRDWILVIAVAAGCIANVVTNFLLLRCRRSIGTLTVIRVGAIVGLAVFVVIAVILGPPSAPSRALDWPARLGCATLSYLCAAYLLFGYVILPEISVRLRILQELADSGAVPRQAILDTYGSTEILRLRLDRLTRSGQIVRRGDRYVTGRPRLLYAAKLFWLLKRLLLHGVVDHQTHLPPD